MTCRIPRTRFVDFSKPKTKKKTKKRKHYFRPNELPKMNILKSLSCKLTEDIYLVMAYMYSPQMETRNLPDYRWVGIIQTKEYFENMIQEMGTHYGNDWMWPEMPEYQIQFKHIPKCRQGQEWFQNRLLKATSFDQFIKDLNYTQAKGWPLDKYSYDDGRPVDLLNSEELISMVGHQFSRQSTSAERSQLKTKLIEKIV